jgi:FemAB-related protein (PEP-CTERM system-associated)
MSLSISAMAPDMTSAGAAEWDDYVARHPDGSFFHRAAWASVLREAFGHAPHFLLARRAGAIAGVLPLALQKSPLFGSSLIALPFCVYGGPLSDDAEVEAALTEAAEALMARLGQSAMEWRTRTGFAGDPPPGWQERSDLYVTFRKPISADHEANLKAIPRKQRAVVRKGIDKGIDGVLTSELGQDVDLCHRIYAESVRNLGTPVFPRRYFALLKRHFGEALDVLTVFENGQARASVLNFTWKGEVLPYYGGGTEAARSCHANDFMYWEVMRHATARGCASFDFGRSKVGTGAFAFKKNWGFAPTPLPYRYRLAEGASVPDHNPLNPKYRLFIAAWKKLPLPVANRIGPFIVRGLG